MKHLLLAPNAFKHSLSAEEAAKALERGFQKSKLNCTTTLFPIADGGNGTGKLIHQHLKGKWIHQEVTDPIGRPHHASFSLIHHGRTAVIEMAEASGIHLLAEKDRNPLLTSSTGTGQLIKAALDQNVKTILLGMGGSATVDGGAGMLASLGVEFLDQNQQKLKPIPKELSHTHTINFQNIDPRLKETELLILCDVQNPLLGENGAARVFGPQKGATPEAVDFLEKFLIHFAQQIKLATGKDIGTIASGGTAGGAAAGLYAFADAKLVNGIDYFLKITKFCDFLKKSDLVITGEGSIDEQTLLGKGPYGVARLAQQHQLPCIAFSGRIPKNPSKELKVLFDDLIPITPEGIPLQKALKATSENLEKAALKFGNALAIKSLQ